MLIYEGKKIATDDDGYLKDIKLWNESIAEIIAKKEGIKLSSESWEVIHFVRNFYIEFNISPALRILIKAMNNKFSKVNKINSRYLFRLFPKGPAKQATKIAGLPKPVKCL